MSDNSYADDNDDLPRTVRQQKEARARDLMAREAQRPAAAMRPPGRTGAAVLGVVDDSYPTLARTPPGEDPPAMVTRLQLPFFHLMGFLIKAVLAGIPALILAVVLSMSIFWVAGQVVEHYAPWLVKMRVVISFPG